MSSCWLWTVYLLACPYRLEVQWLTSIAQALLLQNWLAGPIGLIVFIPFYFLRVGPEEKMMLDRFGDEYRQYMQKTGSVIPKFR